MTKKDTVLTQRQREVIKLRNQGYPQTEIARKSEQEEGEYLCD